MRARIIILAALSAIMAVGCSNKSKAIRYLEGTHPELTVQVTECGKTRDLVDPQPALTALWLILSRTSTQREFYAYDDGRQGNTIERLSSIVVSPVQYSDDYPEECDSRGFAASCLIDGRPREVVFYLAHDGDILHDSIEELDSFTQLITDLSRRPIK